MCLLWGSIEQPHLLEDLVEVHQQPDRYRATRMSLKVSPWFVSGVKNHWKIVCFFLGGCKFYTFLWLKYIPSAEEAWCDHGECTIDVDCTSLELLVYCLFHKSFERIYWILIIYDVYIWQNTHTHAYLIKRLDTYIDISIHSSIWYENMDMVMHVFLILCIYTFVSH